MKIAVISSTVFTCPPPGYAGLEMIAWQTAEGLAIKGHEVTLIAPEGSVCDHATVLPTGPPGGWNEQQAFNHYSGELHKFDVIIDESWLKFTYLRKGHGGLDVPVLGVCHAPVNTMFGSLPPGVEKPCFVCISKDQASHFEALYGRPARVACNGVDLGFYKPMPGVRRSKRFLFLARFSTIKGPDLAIEACKKVGVELDLVGDTSITNEPEYLEKCKALCDGKQIRMVGPAARGECVWWFSQAHCLLHPNKNFREPFGLAPVEAMACGCPVIAWDYGAMRETICHEAERETGILVNSMVDLQNTIVSIAASGMYDAKRRKRCREWASQFSVQNMVNRYEELCQEAIEKGW